MSAATQTESGDATFPLSHSGFSPSPSGVRATTSWYAVCLIPCEPAGIRQENRKFSRDIPTGFSKNSPTVSFCGMNSSSPATANADTANIAAAAAKIRLFISSIFFHRFPKASTINVTARCTRKTRTADWNWGGYLSVRRLA